MTEPSPSFGDLSLLYVDDDEDMWRLLERPLRRRVKEVHYARNGREGLEVAERERPQVIVTDLQMPVMDGLEMIAEARRRPQLDIPIIVVTAFSDSGHHTDLADGYVYKPLNIRTLLEKIAEVLATRA
ncbi:response regulator [Endothiovibrio diazotrophicus]